MNTIDVITRDLLVFGNENRKIESFLVAAVSGVELHLPTQQYFILKEIDIIYELLNVIHRKILNICLQSFDVRLVSGAVVNTCGINSKWLNHNLFLATKLGRTTRGLCYIDQKLKHYLLIIAFADYKKKQYTCKYYTICECKWWSKSLKKMSGPLWNK